jgi:hypothetical protein
VLSLPDLPAYLKDTSISASSSAATAIASAARPSSSTANAISSRPTTARTRCTAATWASASTCGRCWAAAAAEQLRQARASLARGINGFPGNLDVTALISVSSNTLTLAYEATTDAPTPISLTWHPYFNLSGIPRAASTSSSS